MIYAGRLHTVPRPLLVSLHSLQVMLQCEELLVLHLCVCARVCAMAAACHQGSVRERLLPCLDDGKGNAYGSCAGCQLWY
eukprot:2089675-Amphidinium_carterae.1